MLALALPNSSFDKQSVTFFINLLSLISREGLVLGGTQGPKCFSRFERSRPSSLSRKPCTAQADSAFPPSSSQYMRSGFALRPLPSRNAISVQDFLPTLVKREDARSGFTTSSFNSYLKPKDASQNYPDCHRKFV